ncbi:MAG: hypothetical protein ACOH2H_24695 [Cypionkella sp.]
MTSPSPEPSLLPRIALRVGVTGHRAHRFTPESVTSVVQSAEILLKALSAGAAEAVPLAVDVVRQEEPRLRLVTSLAEGSDSFLAEAAVANGYQLDVVLPYRASLYAAKFSEANRARLANLEGSGDVASVLLLDDVKDFDDKAQIDRAYLDAGRIVLDHSDILIAVWDGEPPKGIGGTGQIVEEARERRIPVLWIRLDGMVHFSNAATSTDAGGRADWHDLDISLPTAQNVISVFTRDRLLPPDGDHEKRYVRQFASEKRRGGSHWFAYDLLRWLFAGRIFSPQVIYSSPETDEAWGRFHAGTEAIFGARFSGALRDDISPKARAADLQAIHYSHAYRSAYVTNFGLAALATLMGSLGSFFATGPSALMIKAGFVMVEVLIIVSLIFLISYGRRHDWHRRWLEYRQIAELLRAARLAVMLGASTGAAGEENSDSHGSSWVEWFVRSTLREVDPPNATMDATTLKRIIALGLEEEIRPEIAYHRRASAEYYRISESMRKTGEAFFWGALVSAILFIIYAFSDHFMRLVDPGMPPADIHEGLAGFAKNLVTVFGASLPAFAAALFGIRATGDFDMAVEESSRMEKELGRIARLLEKEAENPDRRRVVQLFSDATRAMSGDLRLWGLIYRHRELQA